MTNTAARIIDLFLHIRKLRSTDGARLTIQVSNEQHIRYHEIFVWGSDVPDESHFTKNTLVESDIEFSAVTEALKTAPVSCVVASFVGPTYDINSPHSLSRLLNGCPGIDVQGLWTQGISWKFLHQLPFHESQTWQTLTSITLDLSIETIEDQVCCVDVLAKGHLRRFLLGLNMFEHLDLSLYSDLPSDDAQFSHGPLEHVLDPQVRWPRLRSVRLDGFDSTAQELVHLLGNHSATLRVLKLHNYFLLSGSWLHVLPEIRDTLRLDDAEVAGAVEGGNELWLVKIPGQQENCFLAEDLTYWLANPKVNLLCPLSKENMARDNNLNEDSWE